MGGGSGRVMKDSKEKNLVPMNMMKSEDLIQRILWAGDWFVRAQCRMRRPYWDANHGRFPYNTHLPTGRTVWGLNWSCARGIMVLIAADQLRPDERYMEAARAAAEYIELLQVLDPRRESEHGAIREEVPQSRQMNMRDQAEAASAMLYLGVYLGEPRLVDNARLWAEWYLDKAVDPSTGWPCMHREPDGTWTRGNQYFLMANGLCLYHLGKRTGNERYLREGVLRPADYALAHCFHATGALKMGEQTVFNEDGAIITLMAAHRLSGDQRYRRAVERHMELVMDLSLPVPSYSGLGSLLICAAEMARVWHSPSALAYIGKALPHLLVLQITDSQAAERGAFIGEDESPEWYSGGTHADYVTTRATAYGALALARIEGSVVTGGYSSEADLPVRGG